jgi:hypothetical protein
MQQDAQNDRTRRRCGVHAAEQWSKRGEGGGRGKGERVEQGGANKKTKRTTNDDDDDDDDDGDDDGVG